MKKIDKLLLKSFIGPFAVSFGVALFVLVMQFLWLYIDEIAGKGVNILIMAELLGYMSVSTFPLALPIAVLIASVMVMGNLAERYELSSMKSAGVSLPRIMASLMFVAAGIALFSYICSDYLIPVSNLKFRTRLFDIRRQKPALSIEEGVFNEDFRQFVIRVGDKADDGETISQVMIEDQTGTGKTKFNQILADSGRMFTSADSRFFVMNLFNGAQYQAPAQSNPNQKSTGRYPFIRTEFDSWLKVWDMKEFEMNRSDEDRFSRQRSMLSMEQLRESLDSLSGVVNVSRQSLATDILLTIKDKTPPPKAPTNPSDTQSVAGNRPPNPSTAAKKTVVPAPNIKKENKVAGMFKPEQKPAETPAKPTGPVAPPQQLEKPAGEYASFLETFPASHHVKIIDDATRFVKLARTRVESSNKQVLGRRTEYVKTGYELYMKYCFALICFVFLFIGAPMGALIRKGGFGYPLLVSIVFFVTFIFLTILCRKLAESFVMTPFWAAMMPAVVMAPLGAFLTVRAMNDSQLFSTDRIDRLTHWLKKRFKSKEMAA